MVASDTSGMVSEASEAVSRPHLAKSVVVFDCVL